jgi:hypothetical protein
MFSIYVFPFQISSLTQTVLNGVAEWLDVFEIFSETKLKKIYQTSFYKYLSNSLLQIRSKLIY